MTTVCPTILSGGSERRWRPSTRCWPGCGSYATRRCLSARSWIAGWSRDSWRSSAGSSGPRTFTRGIRACMRAKPASVCSRCFCVRSPHSPSASRPPSRGCWRSRRCCSRAGRMSAAPIRPGSRAPGASAPARWPSSSEGCPTSSGLKRFSTRGFSMPRMRRQMPFGRSRSTWRPHFPTALPARAPVDPRRWTCSCGRATSSAPPLETHARALGAGSWREALSRLADRRPPTQGDQARYAQVWQQAREAADAHGLVTWVTDPISFVPQPVWAREAAPSLYFLFYRAPAAFDRLPVVDYFVTPGAHESAIKLTHVIHHAGLGHHLQNWYAYHRAASRVGQVAAIDCASRIAMFCGGTMAEGWACYATDVMEEIGFLDAFDQLALAHTRLRIAARAAVDVRLHTGRWTLEQAEACYRDDAGMSAEAARAEAVKNSLFPGTALAYLTGTDAIHRLRRQLSARPGFELGRFHDALLAHGSVPVTLVAQAMGSGWWPGPSGRGDPVR